MYMHTFCRNRLHDVIVAAISCATGRTDRLPVGWHDATGRHVRPISYA